MHEQTAVVRLPLEGPIFALVEDWRRSQSKIPSRNEAIRLLAGHAKQVAEGAGAASLAAAIKLRDELRGKKVVGIATGGNIPAERFAMLMTKESLQ